MLDERALTVYMMMNMRRVILIFLTLFFPLQGTWAAMATYCTHETSAGETQHLGHHFHKHQAPADDSPGDSSRTGGIDKDCSFCHLNLKLAHTTSFESRLNCELYLVEVPLLAHYSSYIPEAPERPKWWVLV